MQRKISRVSQTAGLIAAASQKATQPTFKLDQVTVVEQQVIILQQAGVFPIVVVTGVEAEEVRYRLAGRGVVFLFNQAFQDPELLASLRIGLEFLYQVSQRIVFAPANVPLFTPYTLHKLLTASGDLVTPACRNRGGHPIVIVDRLIPAILNYQGEGGLRGFMAAHEELRIRIPVNDPGVLLTLHQPEELQQYYLANRRSYLHPGLRLNLEDQVNLFDQRAKLLLFLIGKTASVSQAARMMALSLSKAWEVLNQLEAALGFQVLTRRQGGRGGSRSQLTARGLQFLRQFQAWEERVRSFSQQALGNLLAGLQ
ncbi:MAG: NTP transferase domain-containing protein [Oscillospiraceae bacterium]|nr:NTP transferase domain-containing protein [Oscillospiraceae bacterium]MDD4368258.1 NTP transferase domain-containing protein [Oscillospiraceae bacterium]